MKKQNNMYLLESKTEYKKQPWIWTHIKNYFGPTMLKLQMDQIIST